MPWFGAMSHKLGLAARQTRGREGGTSQHTPERRAEQKCGLIVAMQEVHASTCVIVGLCDSEGRERLSAYGKVCTTRTLGTQEFLLTRRNARFGARGTDVGRRIGQWMNTDVMG